MTIAVEAPDAERAVVDWLTGKLDGATVGVGIPSNWDRTNPSQTPHVRVASDGTPTIIWPAAQGTTIRLVAYHPTTTGAKRLAARSQGILCSIPADGITISARPLTGVLPGQDPDTGAQIASTTTEVLSRTTQIAP